jgi:hypothetical protein
VKKNWFVLIAFFLSLAAHALEVDSAKVSRLVKTGSAAFCQILENNQQAIEQHRSERMQFVIDVPVNYLNTESYGEAAGPTLTDQTIKDSLNARLKNIYLEYHVELYIVLINSLDVLISTPLPAGTTSDVFFKAKLYNENSNIASLKALHDVITDRIISQSLSGNNRDCLILSDAQYCGAFFANNQKGCWDLSVLSSHDGNTVTYPQLHDLKNYFAERLRNNHDALAGGINGQMVTTVDEFKEAVRFVRLKSSIRQTFIPFQLDDIFSQFNEQIDYENLSLAERVHVLSVYTGFAMSGNWLGNTGQETHAIKVIKYTPAEDVHELLYYLEQPNGLKGNPQYTGDVTDDVLIKKLIDHTDDAILSSDNNYTLLVTVLTKLIVSDQQTFDEHRPQETDNWLDRIYYWDDSYLFTTAPIGTHKYTVDWSAGGKISIQKQIVDQWTLIESHVANGTSYYEAHWDNYDPVELHPFDLVFFTNRSNNGMLQSAGAKKSDVFLAPAIFLKYAGDKTFNANALKSGAIALDVIALATGPAAILAAVESGATALCAFEVAQFLGSAGNLALNSITDPDLQSVVEKYNMIVAVWGLSHIATSGAKFTMNYFTDAVAGELQVIPVATATEFEHAFQQAGGKIDELSVGVKEEVKKMEEYLEGKVGGIPSGGFNIEEIAHLLHTEPNTVFCWSGETNGIGGADVALEIAEANGGVTLESLMENRNIILPLYNAGDPQNLKVWTDVSREYAKQASGEVKAVVGQSLGSSNIWEDIELPALIANPNVTKITKIDPASRIETIIFVR